MGARLVLSLLFALAGCAHTGVVLEGDKHGVGGGVRAHIPLPLTQQCCCASGGIAVKCSPSAPGALSDLP